MHTEHAIEMFHITIANKQAQIFAISSESD